MASGIFAGQRGGGFHCCTLTVGLGWPRPELHRIIGTIPKERPGNQCGLCATKVTILDQLPPSTTAASRCGSRQTVITYGLIKR